jgi:tetratricopeptide (TPR) repeat protein
VSGEKPKNPWIEPAGEVLALLKEGKPASAWVLIQHRAETLPTTGPFPGFNETALAMYWHHRDLDAHVAVSEERLRRLREALDKSENGERGALVRAEGGTNYNMASFTWPGWGEEDVTPSDSAKEAGRRAATRCLDIRTDPANADYAFGYDQAMAHWVVGAWALSDGDYNRARKHFTTAREDCLAKNEDDALYTGYLALADVLEHPGDPAAESHFTSALTTFEERKDDEDAAFFREQLINARKALSLPMD